MKMKIRSIQTTVMKVKNTLFKVLVLVGFVAALAFAFVNWRATQVQAVQGPKDRIDPLGFLELAVGQSARLTVVNIQPPPEPDSPPPDPDTPPPEPDQPPPDPDSPPPEPDSPPPDPERVRLAFDVYVQDEENTRACGGIVPVPPTCLVRYRFLRRELREVELMPGQAASLDFIAAEGAKLQAFVQTIGKPGEGSFPTETIRPHLVSSLEVREGTRTLFVAPALAKLFNPQPDPPGH